VTSASLSSEDRSRLRVPYWALVGICLLFAGAGLYLIQWQARPLHNWIPVNATIQRIDSIKQNNDRGHSAQRPVILYSYPVGAVVYTTDRVTPTSDVRDLSTVSTLARQLHEGQNITAYYDPLQPESAYLIRARHRVLYVLFVAPLVLALILLANWPRVRRNT
jgi:hypothetical protein